MRASEATECRVPSSTSTGGRVAYLGTASRYLKTGRPPDQRSADESTPPVSVSVSFSPVQGRPGASAREVGGRRRTGSYGLGSCPEPHEQTSKASVA